MPGDSSDAQKLLLDLAQIVLFAFGQTLTLPSVLGAVPRSFQLSRFPTPRNIESQRRSTPSQAEKADGRKRWEKAH